MNQGNFLVVKKKKKTKLSDTSNCKKIMALP